MINNCIFAFIVNVRPLDFSDLAVTSMAEPMKNFPRCKQYQMKNRFIRFAQAQSTILLCKGYYIFLKKSKNPQNVLHVYCIERTYSAEVFVSLRYYDIHVRLEYCVCFVLKLLVCISSM
jgi:hypothetical protein